MRQSLLAKQASMPTELFDSGHEMPKIFSRHSRVLQMASDPKVS